jgi:ABC-type polysaccharide/polyol phosphate transport system ATPase subunit
MVSLPRRLGGGSGGSFDALKGVSLDVRRGECLGVIGRNGAGKSTLMSMMLGSIRPTLGTVRVAEKVTPLLALGAGFHPDLTGRENALINGVLLGMTRREVEERMDSISEFSGIGEFMDMPSRTYSSGMYMRLAFSVAIHIEPRLLVIDEVLSVGDAAFQRKSREALLGLIDRGVTAVFVSHSLPAVRDICQRAVWLDQGELRMSGPAAEVVAAYERS